MDIVFEWTNLNEKDLYLLDYFLKDFFLNNTKNKKIMTVMNCNRIFKYDKKNMVHRLTMKHTFNVA